MAAGDPVTTQRRRVGHCCWCQNCHRRRTNCTSLKTRPATDGFILFYLHPRAQDLHHTIQRPYDAMQFWMQPTYWLTKMKLPFLYLSPRSFFFCQCERIELGQQSERNRWCYLSGFPAKRWRGCTGGGLFSFVIFKTSPKWCVSKIHLNI